MRCALTLPEAQLWVALRRLRGEGLHFRRQVAFRGYVLDFACYRRRLVVEVDGAQHGGAVLAGEGFRTLRVTAQDVLANLDGVVTAIRLALSETPTPAAPPPTLPTKGEGNRWW